MSVALAVVTYVILALMLLIVGLAMPTFRRMHHNSFEFVHRVSLHLILSHLMLTGFISSSWDGPPSH